LAQHPLMLDTQKLARQQCLCASRRAAALFYQALKRR
jgi:hypothetical protein